MADFEKKYFIPGGPEFFCAVLSQG